MPAPMIQNFRHVYLHESCLVNPDRCIPIVAPFRGQISVQVKLQSYMPSNRAKGRRSSAIPRTARARKARPLFIPSHFPHAIDFQEYLLNHVVGIGMIADNRVRKHGTRTPSGALPTLRNCRPTSCRPRPVPTLAPGTRSVAAVLSCVSHVH